MPAAIKAIFAKLTLKRLMLAIAGLIMITAAAAAATPGPHRALCPTCFDMVEIGDGLYADVSDEARAAELVALVRISQSNVSNYLDGWSASPRILLCTKAEGPCTRMFGNLGPRGTAWGASLVRLNPLGMNKTIMTHELLHAELHTRMGQWGMWNNIIPRWFNEGLAVHLSGDIRFAHDYSDDERAAVRKIVTLQDWKREVNANTWRTVYGASAQNVRDIENKIGRDGIRTLITRVTRDGEKFETVLRSMNAM